MQCVRCQHPLPPRADRCLRCFALNPQNHPEPLPSATPAVPLGAMKVKPLGLSFESDPPPARDVLSGMSFESDPPPRGLAADLSVQFQFDSEPQPRAQGHREARREDPALTGEAGPSFTPLDDADFSFDDPSLAAQPVRVIDILSRPPDAGDSRPHAEMPKVSPEIPDTVPAPPPSGMEPVQPRTLTPPHARMTEPAITPMPDIDLPPLPIERRAALVADERVSHLDELAGKALRLSDPDVPMESLAPLPEAEQISDFAGFQKPAPEAAQGPAARSSDPIVAAQPEPGPLRPALRARLTAWALDAAVIVAISLSFVALAALQLGGRKLAPLGQQSWESWADGLLFSHRLPVFWALLLAAIGLGYSWLFTALGGRTPGLRLAGLKLQHEDGSAIDPVQALTRAALSLPSAALGLFGFVLALVDPRGQTLHDKLCHSLLVVSTDPRPGSS